MSSLEIELVFEGSAVDSGKIDAYALGISLAAYSEVFQRANALANGSESDAVVLVESEFKTGSFEVNLQLIQTTLETGKALITAHPFLSAFDLSVLLGLLWKNRESLIEVLKWLKGRKPDKVVQQGNNVDLILFGQKKTVTNTVNIFLNDVATRDALARAVQPLKQPGIERITIRPKLPDNTQEQVTIEKDEAAYFEADRFLLAPPDEPEEGERDTVLVISKLSFREGPKWSFFERGATVSSSIDDPSFWEDVHRRKYKFAEGDRLRVRLRWKLVDKGNKLKTENAIIKVYEVVQRVKQMRIDGDPDDEVL